LFSITFIFPPKTKSSLLPQAFSSLYESFFLLTPEKGFFLLLVLVSTPKQDVESSK
jgi:hypothetical protein